MDFLLIPTNLFSLLENFGKGRGLSNRRYCGLSVTLESSKLGQVGLQVGPGTNWALLKTSKKQCGVEGHRATRFCAVLFSGDF